MALALIEEGRFSGLDAYEAIFRLSPAATALVQASGPARRIVLANPAFCAIFGATTQGQRLEHVFRGASAEQLQSAVEDCLASGEAVRLRIVHAPAGEVVRLQVELRRVLIRLEHHVVIALSLGERPYHLSELGEAGVLAELGSISRGLVYVHDVSARVLRHGRHPLVKRLGLPGGPLDLDHIRELVHPDDRVRFQAYVAEQAVAPDDQVSKDTFRFRGVDSQWLWINVRSRVFARDLEGKVRRIIGVATDVTDVHTHAVAMAEAASALAHAEMKERRLIGRELHDSTAQLLVAARLGLGSLERQANLSGEPLRALEEVRRSIADAQHELRNFAYMLHPPSLQDEGLEHTLRTFAAGFARRTGLAIAVKVARGDWDLPFSVEVALFRVAQEALMNVYRHARASTAWVRLKRDAQQVVLEIEDDGVGLPIGIRGGKPEGVGTSGMRARMIQLGGAFELTSGEVGVKVRVSVPVVSREPEL